MHVFGKAYWLFFFNFLQVILGKENLVTSVVRSEWQNACKIIHIVTGIDKFSLNCTF